MECNSFLMKNDDVTSCINKNNNDNNSYVAVFCSVFYLKYYSFLHVLLFFLNAALCKLNYIQLIRILSKVFLTYSFSCLFLYFLSFLL